jgi:hypothetical protein
MTEWDGVVTGKRYCADDWARWQQGLCFEYAVALTRLRPDLRFGTLFDDDERDIHFFAHDDRWAYDSAGRHRLPYLGVHSPGRESRAKGAWQDDEPTGYDLPDEDEVADAMAHAVRNGILEARWPVPWPVSDD